MSAGARYVVNFSVEGSGKQDLKEIKGALGGVSSAMAMAGVGAAGIAVGLEKAFDVGTGLIELGMKGVSTFAGMATKMMSAISPLEASMNRMKMIGKLSDDQAKEIVKNAEDWAFFTPFQAQQVIGVAESLITAKVKMQELTDAQGKSLTFADMQAKGFARLDSTISAAAKTQKVTAASMVTDLATATGNIGERMDTFVRGFSRALSTGSYALLRDQVPDSVLKQIFKKPKQKAEETMKNLTDYLKKESLMGASLMASNTFEGIMSNVKEIPERIMKAIGGMPGDGGLYDQIKAEMANVVNTFMDALTPETLASIREGLQPVIAILIKGMQLLTNSIKGLFSYLRDNPQVIKFVTMLGLIGSVAAVAAGGLVLLVATVATAVVGVALLVAALILLPATIAIATGAFIWLGAAIGIAALAYVAFQKNFGGIKTFFENVKLVIMATKEALESWGGATTSISEETAQKLEKAGLMRHFLTVVNFLRQAQVAWEGFASAITKRWDGIKAKFGSAFEAMSAAFSRIAKTIGILIGGAVNSMGVGQEAVDKATSTGERWGHQVANILERVAGMAEWVAKFIDQMVLQVPDAIEVFADVYQGIATAVAYAKMLYHAASMMGEGLALAFEVALIPMEQAFKLMMAITQAAAAISQGRFVDAGKALGQGLLAMTEDLAQRQTEAIAKRTKAISYHYGKTDEASRSIEDIDKNADAMRGKAAELRAENVRKQTEKSYHVAPSGLPPMLANDKTRAENEKMLSAPYMLQAPEIKTSVEMRSTPVQLDGKVIAEVSWEYTKAKMEEAGMLPGQQE